MSTEDVIFFEHPSSDGSVVAEALSEYTANT